ncbi:MAG: ABC transporter ATP-binding protein [Planctomycetota bacterium]
MRDFWVLAKAALVNRGLVACTILFAILSGVNLGAGLLGVTLVMRKVMPGPDGGQDLPQLAAKLNSKIGGHIPQGWIDALPQGSYPALIVMVSMLGLLTIWGGFVNFAHAYLALTLVARFIRDLRDKLFAHIVHLPMRTVLIHGPSFFISHTVHDTQIVGSGISALASRALVQTAKGIAAYTVALTTDYKVTLAATIVAPLLYQVIRKTGKRIRRATRDGLQAAGVMHGSTSEALEHLKIVKCSNAEPAEIVSFGKISLAAMVMEQAIRRAKAMAPPITEVLAILTLGLLAVVAGKAILDGKLEGGQLLMVLASLGFAADCVKPLTSLSHELQIASSAAARVRHVLDMPVEPGHEPSLPTLAPHAKSIEFKNVTFTYPTGSAPALKNINLSLRHGETIAFVGPNGSGKTTLLAMIPRLFDPDEPAPGEESGAILVDGVDIRTINVASLRTQIGMVTQDTMLFGGTVRSNLLYGDVKADDASVLAAIRAARAEEFLGERPQGVDTTVGERGSGFSGGQRQRLAIARAMLRKPAILILDEATSQVDADSEAKIADALDEFAAGRTCLIIAHRLSTVIHADRIVVMDHGTIIDSGTHAELLARCPTYKLIADRQLFGGHERPGNAA